MSSTGSTTTGAAPAQSERDAAVAAYKRKFLEHRDVESSMYCTRHIYTLTATLQCEIHTVSISIDGT